MKVEFEVEEGDLVHLQDRTWKIEEINKNKGHITAVNSLGDTYTYNFDELRDMINFSGKFEITKESYVGISTKFP